MDFLKSSRNIGACYCGKMGLRANVFRAEGFELRKAVTFDRRTSNPPYTTLFPTIFKSLFRIFPQNMSHCYFSVIKNSSKYVASLYYILYYATDFEEKIGLRNYKIFIIIIIKELKLYERDFRFLDQLGWSFSYLHRRRS